MSLFADISSITKIKTEYSPYRELPQELARVLESVRVRNVTAVYYECTRKYSMAPRRIGDDMFYFIVQGKAEVVIEGRRTVVAAGDAANFTRGVLHAANTHHNQPFHVIGLHYDATMYESLALPHLLNFPDTAQVGLGGAFHEMAQIACREYTLRPPGWEKGLEALVLRLLLCYVREYIPPTVQLESTGWNDLRRVRPATEWVRRNLHETVTVAQLAARCHLSEPHFRRIFARAMGAAPNAYIRRLRIEEAARLLRSSDETIDVIATLVGYSDPSFFARSFKEQMGIAPGKYRELPSV